MLKASEQITVTLGTELKLSSFGQFWMERVGYTQEVRSPGFQSQSPCPVDFWASVVFTIELTPLLDWRA